MNKKITYTVALIVLLALSCLASLAGCTPAGEQSPPPAGESTPPQGETPSPGAATVRFAGFSAGESHGQTMADMLALFADAYPGITVIDESAGYIDYFPELAAGIGSGGAPDVFELDDQNLSGFVRQDALAPLDGLAAAHGTDLGAYQTGLVDRICTVRGSLMALPFGYSAEVLVYNMDLFDAAGLKYPTDGWLWEDVLLAAQKIADPQADTWGYYEDMSDVDVFYKRARQNNEKFYTGAGNFTINAPRNVETLQWMQDMIWVYRSMPTEAERAGRSGIDLFAAGKLGMFPVDTGVFAELSDRSGGIRWDIAPEPGHTDKAARVSCSLLCVNSATEVSDAAYTLAQFLSGDPGVQRLRLDAGWDLPPVSGVVDAYMEDTPPANKEAVLASTAYAVIPPPLWDRDAVIDEVLPPYLEAVRDNTLIPLEALTEAQAEAESRLGQ